MRQKKLPLRKCSGCGEMKTKKELVRIVKSPQKNEDEAAKVELDLTGKKPGRGAYLCRDPECLEKARKARRFEKAFSMKIPDEVFAKMQEEISADLSTEASQNTAEKAKTSKEGDDKNEN